MSPSGAHQCPKCAGDVREGWRVCPACATPLRADEDAETKTMFAASSGSSVEEGRFPAGTVLAGRSRVLGLIGHGGMGEVYRAYDLILNQAVALKFLGRANIGDAALARFRNEVRIARQVSHPNVCRVYDIGFIEGFHFLSMEYLDGEDLASLIRRIGRLPQDKAIEFARKICAGLAAAHERGVLHRDLKPANIMIDGRGQVRITDFGLAALAQEVALGDIRSGTPAYMSPEQKAGKEVTTRSDLYSLGLVLYEMLTGKRRSDTQTNPTDLVKDLDPAVERVILRCLEQEPRRRPSSALNVAMALPGGDPIAAALAAGETPSPEMVAASGEKEGFSPRTAWLCLGGIVLSIAVVLLPPFSRISLLSRAPVEIPPEALAFRAQDMLKEFGYAEKPVSTAYGFDCCDGPNQRFVKQHEPAQRDAMLATHQPPVIRFWYRQSQGQLVPQDPGPVSYDSPPNSEPTMVRLALDATGRLIALEARPPQDSQGDGHASAFNWAALFKEARLDPAQFKPIDPSRTPPMAFDTRMAWVGTYTDERKEQIRVEAAAWQGRPVYFDVSGEWRKTGESTEYRPAVLLAVLLFLFVFLVAGAAFVAWRNLRSGRGDRKGAARIAAIVFLSRFCGDLLAIKHVAGPDEVGLLVLQAGETLFLAVLVWLAYVAIEPYARRYWPDSLISWNRLLSGRLRDSLTASHILAGFLLYSAGVAVIPAASVVMSASPIVLPGLRSLNGTAIFAGSLFGSGAAALEGATAFLLLVILLRLLLRRVWIADFAAALACIAIGPALDFSNPYRFAVIAVLYLLWFLGLVWMLRRLGLVSVLAWFFAAALSNTHPWGTPGSWYAGYFLAVAGIVIAINAWAVWVVLSAQRRPVSESAG